MPGLIHKNCQLILGRVIINKVGGVWVGFHPAINGGANE